jgi:hypothetical protein
MKTLEDFLEPEIEEFESPEFQTEFQQLSNARKNDILFKRLLFDYDEELQDSLKKFIKSNGTEPAWLELIRSFPEIKYIHSDDPAPVSIAKIVLKETTLQ